MPRRAILLAAIAALVFGCGESPPASLTEQGLKELRTGNYDEAIASCTEAIRQNPQDPEAFLYRGKAYHYRNAMGDAKRAIGDFTEVIRLAPDSSDAYYMRSLVYRDLGQSKLAQADDAKARELDGQLQSMYRQLPEPPLPSGTGRPQEAETPGSESTAAAGPVLPKSNRERRALFDKLKEEFAPKDTSLFGEKREEDSPLARYRELLNERQERMKRTLPTAQADQMPGGDSAVPGNLVPRAPQWAPTAPRLTEEPLPAQAPPRATQSLSSPFQPPVAPLLTDEVGRGPAAGIARPLQSPFGQRTPAPTGYGVQPVNPFSQRPLQPNQLPRTVTPDTPAQPVNPYIP